MQRIEPTCDVGVCTVEHWKHDWPGCRYENGVTEGRLSVVDTDHGRAYRVDYAVGQIGPTKGGVGWRYPITPADVAELTYHLTFGPDFDWVKGGKLPGLCGGPESVTGGNPANGKNGFSMRLMWRAEGRGEAYVYHLHQPGMYGESFRFPADFRFRTNESYRIRMRVAMNTPGERDGRLDVWVGSAARDEPQHVVSRSDMEWRATRDFGIDSLLFETFHGGSDSTWAPRRPSFALFGDIAFDLPDTLPVK